MRQLIALIRHEITEGRMVLLTAFVAGWLPILAPFLPGVEHHHPDDVRLAVIAVLLIFLGTLLVIGIGFSVIGRDLAERRFGFYLAQPVAGWALWLGKLLGAYALALSALTLMLLPTAAVSWKSKASQLPPLWLMLLGLLAILLLLALSHAASIMARDRTVWLIVDLIALAVVLALGWTAVDRLLSEQAELSLYTTIGVVGAGLLLALLVAGGAQVVHGRSDLGRGHRFLSLTLWPAVILIALAFVAHAQWLVTPSLADLEHPRLVVPASRGSWLAVGGDVRDGNYRAVFLLDSASGESHHLGSLVASGNSLTFSADGETVVWARCRRLWEEPCDLWWWDLDEGGEARRLDFEIGAPTAPLALSADGSRLAIYQASNLAVFSLPEGRLLAAIKIDRPETFRFETRDRLRLLESRVEKGTRRHEWRQFEIDSGQLVLDEQLVIDHGSMWIRRIVDYLASLTGTQRTRLYEDLISEGFYGQVERMYPMTSGELVVVAGRLHNQPQIFVLSPEGEKREIALPHETRVWSLLLGGEAEPGKLTIGWLRPETATATMGTGTWSTHLLDIQTGELRFLADHAVPLHPATPPSAGTMATRILVSRDALLLWDPERQETRPLITFKTSQSSFRDLASSSFYQSLRFFYR